MECLNSVLIFSMSVICVTNREILSIIEKSTFESRRADLRLGECTLPVLPTWTPSVKYRYFVVSTLIRVFLMWMVNNGLGIWFRC